MNVVLETAKGVGMKFFMLPIFIGFIASLYVGHTSAYAIRSVRVVASEDQLTVKDVVKKIREDDDGAVIMLKQNQGNYYLRRTHSAFDNTLKKLKQSEKAGTPVTVTADKAELNILDVK